MSVSSGEDVLRRKALELGVPETALDMIANFTSAEAEAAKEMIGTLLAYHAGRQSKLAASLLCGRLISKHSGLKRFAEELTAAY